MDIKKLAFRYADKVGFAVMAILLAYTVIESSLFGDALRFLREPLDSVTSTILPVKPFLLDQLQADVSDYDKKIKEQLERSQPPRLTELTQPDELKSSPPAAVELRAHLWNVPSEEVESVNITQGLKSSLNLKERIGKDPPKIKNPDLLKVEVKDSTELELTGLREGKTELEWRDVTGVRHMRFVEIAKFVAEATVAPPTNLKAAMESAGVRLTWDPSPTIEPRAPVTGYNIYRRKADEADYKKVGSTTVGEAKPDTEPVGPEGQPSPEAAQAKAGRSYLDNSIEFDAKYSYTVRAVAAKAKPPESDPSTAAEIEVPRDVEFFVKTVSAKNASIKVWKLANKEWKSRTYMAVYPGESIGAVYATPARGGKPAETVDYRTGATLVDFDASAARQKKLILSKPVRDERGVMVNIDEIRLVPDIYKGKIVYLDKRGELKEKWMGKEELEEVYKRFPGLGVPAAAAPKPAAPEGGAPPPPPGEEKKGPQELKPE